jgi:hypothetical protein
MTRTILGVVLVSWLAGSGVAAAQSSAPDPAAQSARELLTVPSDLLQQVMNRFMGAIAESSRPGLQQAPLKRPASGRALM